MSWLVYLKIIFIAGSGACDVISLDNLFYKQGTNYKMVVCEESTEIYYIGFSCKSLFHPK